MGNTERSPWARDKNRRRDQRHRIREIYGACTLANGPTALRPGGRICGDDHRRGASRRDILQRAPGGRSIATVMSWNEKRLVITRWRAVPSPRLTTIASEGTTCLIVILYPRRIGLHAHRMIAVLGLIALLIGTLGLALGSRRRRAGRSFEQSTAREFAGWRAPKPHCTDGGEMLISAPRRPRAR